MRSIFKKELYGYFGNWSAWLIVGAFSVICSLFLFFFDNDSNIFEIGNASLQSYFSLAPWILLFIIPAISMKSIAEEQQTGTLYWLFSQPLKTTQIVLGKFFSVWVIGLFCVLPSLIYFYTIYILGVPEGNLDIGATLGSYLGLFLIIATFSAVGLLTSAMAKNQISAYLLGLFINFILYYGIEQLANYKLLGTADFILQNIGFYHHFIGFTRGLLSSEDICYFLLIIFLSLYLAVYFVQKKK